MHNALRHQQLQHHRAALAHAGRSVGRHPGAASAGHGHGRKR
jgi:hypothetical protein